MRDALRRHWADITVALLLVAVTFPTELRRRPGLDPSWMAGLQMAASQHLVFGRRVVFTYGPLGYLDNPVLYVARPGVLSVLLNVVLTFVLAYVTVRLLRARFSSPIAWMIAVVVVIVVRWDPSASPVLVMLAVAWAVWWMLRGRRPSLGPVIAMGVLFAPAVLIKFSCVECLIVLGVAVVVAAFLAGGARLSLRHGAAFIVSSASSLLVAWVLAGQPLSAFPIWFSRSLEVARGYSDAMGRPMPAYQWIYPVGVVLVALAVGAVWTARELSARLRVGLLIVLVTTAAMSYKESYVRQLGLAFFAVGVVVALSLLPLLDRRLALTALAVTLIPVLVFKADGGMLDAHSHLSAMSTFTRFVVSSDSRRTFLRVERATALDVYRVPRWMLAAMDGHSVDIQPAAILVAYGDPRLHWHPSPVLQSYVAYTPALDSMNARFLSGRNAPDFVLRDPALAIDFRLARFESPDATLALMCHYRQRRSGGPWQLLARSKNRCGTPRRLTHVQTALGKSVQIPKVGAQDRIVIARFHGLASSIPERLQSLATHGVELWLGTGWWNRFLQGTQGDAHIVSIPSCAHETLDGPALNNATSFVMTDQAPSGFFGPFKRTDNGTTRRHDSYGVEFSEIPFRC